MTETPTPYAKRQILGRRLGLEPYYTVEEQTDTRLLLRSRPDANRRAGRKFAGCGTTVLLLSLTFYCISFVSSQGQLGPYLTGTICALPFGIIGGVGLIGGLAIAKTVNTITIDKDERQVIYTQKSRRERTQRLGFDQITRVRLRTQRFNASFFLRREQPIRVLLLVTDADQEWVLDSSVEDEHLLPLAQRIAGLLDVPLEREPVADAEG
jgi:hypothetical protein